MKLDQSEVLEAAEQLCQRSRCAYVLRRAAAILLPMCYAPYDDQTKRRALRARVDAFTSIAGGAYDEVTSAERETLMRLERQLGAVPDVVA